MKEKNGIEMKTGDIVEISGAYFKNDNGLYFIEYSPGDPSWSGLDYCLKRISKTGKISKAKHNTCFWPIGIFISDYFKRSEAQKWNEKYAQIEVKSVKSMEEVAGFFRFKAEEAGKHIQRMIFDWGEDHPEVQKYKDIRDHYLNVIQRTK